MPVLTTIPIYRTHRPNGEIWHLPAYFQPLPASAVDVRVSQNIPSYDYERESPDRYTDYVTEVGK